MNMMKKIDKKHMTIYVLAFLIPVLVMAIGCIRAGVFPFGDRTFLRNDMYHQYIQFFTSMYDKVWGGEGLAYSMQLGFGSNTASIYSYYLASPLTLLALLVPRAYIAECMAVIVIIKMGFAGVGFAYYATKRYDKADLGILFFSSAYALSGYMAAYHWNLMWLDVIALAPFVLEALEELIEEGKGVKYCVLLAVSIYTNYYLSIMLCIFLALYFVSVIVWKPWKIMWRRSLQFGIYSLTAGALTSSLLIPAYYAMSTTERTSVAFPKMEWYMNFWEFIGRQCISTPWAMSDAHWPNIYCGAAILLLIPLYVLNRNISMKDKIGKLALIAVLVISFMNKVLDYIWHGLNFPNSMPGRQAFLYILLLLIIGYEVYANLKAVRIWELLLAGAISYAALSIAAVRYPVVGADSWAYGITLGLMRIYFGIILTYCIFRIPAMQEYLAEKKWYAFVYKYPVIPKMIVLLMVVAELACNMYDTGIRTSSRNSFNEFYDAQSGAAQWLRDNDDSLYRTELFTRKSKNDGMMWNVNTATIFASSAEIKTRNFYERVGMGAAKGSYWFDGATPLISAMLGVKYMIGPDNSMINDLYQLVYSDGDGNLYQCQYTLPMGYVVNQQLDESWDTVGNNPIELQNELCRLIGIPKDLLVPVTSIQEGDCKYRVEVTETSYVYVYLGGNDVNKVKISVDGKERTLGQVSFDYLMNVGKVEPGQVATLEGVETDYKFNTFEAYAVDLDVLQQVLDILGQTPLEIIKHGEGYIEGNVDLIDKGELVISVAADDGWKVYVDGEKAETSVFEDMFLSVNLEAGAHHIVIEYEQPGTWTGRLISLGALAVLAVCIFAERKKKVV